mmetsp:Transcript_3591/g.5436  ORF Transcript_3591/g.5436 Transcript_3591/m.5436 type:complete len:394 (+) Transcript_3591:85-1266(+)
MNNNNNNEDNNNNNKSLFSSPFSSTTTNNTTPALQEERKQIYEHFANIVKSKFQNPDNVKKLDTIYSNTQDYEFEKNKLTDMNNNGLTKGLITGVCVFGFLRLGPRMMAKYAMRHHQSPPPPSSGGGGGGKGYTFDVPSSNVRSPFDAAKKNATSHTHPNFQSNQGGGQHNRMEYKPSLLMRTFKFTVDVTLSILISVYASAILTDRQQLLKDASEIPLVQGKSLLSQELCVDFRKEYSRYEPQVWERQKDDLLMNAIRDVVVNCRKRDLYERQIREESGMGAEEEVLIPSPGVPIDLDVGDMEGETEGDINRAVGKDGEEKVKGDYDDDSDAALLMGNDEHNDYYEAENTFELEDENEQDDAWNNSSMDFEVEKKKEELKEENQKPRRRWGW